MGGKGRSPSSAHRATAAATPAIPPGSAPESPRGRCTPPHPHTPPPRTAASGVPARVPAVGLQGAVVGYTLRGV